MKTVLFAILAVCSFGISAGQNQYGVVTDVQPIFGQQQQVQQQQPYEVCEKERGNGNLIGAGIGGLVGNQFGKGKGKIAMTVLGAVAGSQVGNTKRVCHTVYPQQQQVTSYYDNITYQVTYEVNGVPYVVYSKRNPGVGYRIVVDENGDAY